MAWLMRTTTDFAVLIVSPNTSFEFAPKNRTATCAIPQVITTLAITPRITKSATSSQPHGTRKSSEITARNRGAPGGTGVASKVCGAGSCGSMAGGSMAEDGTSSEELSTGSFERALTGAAPDGL